MDGFHGGVRIGFGSRPQRLSVVFCLVFLAVYLLQLLVPGIRTQLVTWFALHTDQVFGTFHIWQPLTAIFLHVCIWDLLFAIILFYVFGNDIAHAWTTAEYLTLVLLAGVVGGLCVVALGFFSGTTIIACGAMGSAFGLMAAYAITYGDRELLLFFILPVRARRLVMGCFAIVGLLALLGVLNPVTGAQLGGGLAGFLLIRAIRGGQNRGFGSKGHRPPARSRMGGLEVMSDDD